MPALGRFVLSTLFSFSSKVAAVSGADLEEKKPSCGCAVQRRKDAVSGGERTLSSSEEEDADLKAH